MAGDLAIQNDDGDERARHSARPDGDAAPSAAAPSGDGVARSKRKGAEEPSRPALSNAPKATRSLIDALQNPALTADQFQSLVVLERDLADRTARIAYSAALAQMQTELPTIQERGGIKDRAGNVMARYALWEDIVGVVTPVLARHGFSLTFRTSSGDGLVSVTGVLSHAEGHEERTSLTLPIDSSGAKNVVQSIGSSTSYGKRYTASALLNLRSGTSEDDDGIRGGGAASVTDEQAANIEALISEVGANKSAMLEWLKVASIDAIPATKYSDVIAKLEAKRK